MLIEGTYEVWSCSADVGSRVRKHLGGGLSIACAKGHLYGGCWFDRRGREGSPDVLSEFVLGVGSLQLPGRVGGSVCRQTRL